MAVKRLTILLDQDDLGCLEVNCPQALSGTVIAFDIDLHALLLDRRINHLSPWDVVQPDECSRVQDFYAQVWDFWQACGQAELDGLDCFKLAAYRHVCCLKRLAWTAYALRRCLDELQPDELVTFEETSGHGLDQPARSRKMPLLFALARGLAEQAGIAVRLLRRADAVAETGFVDQPTAVGTQRYERVEPSTVLVGRPFVMFTGSGHDLLRQLPVIQALQRQDEPLAVQLYKSADQQIQRVLRGNGHLLWRESQVTDEIDLTQFGSWVGEARRGFDRRRRDAPDRLRCIFGNPHMNMHFDFMFGEYLRRMAWHVKAWPVLFEKHRPQLLVANYAAPIVDIAAHLGIPTLVLPHGLMSLGDHAFPLALPEPAVIGALSDLHVERLSAWGIAPARIRVTGDPGFDGQLPHAARPEPSPSAAAPRRRQAARRRRILLLTGNLGLPSATSHLPEIDWADAVRCFEAIGRLAARREDWEFTIKCHPRYDHPLLYNHVNRNLPPDRRMRVVTDERPDFLARVCDVVVCVNVKSSAIFEASVARKPVFLLHQSMIWLDRQAWGIDRWPQIATVEQLESELDAIFTDPGLYRARVDQTCHALRSCFGGDPVPAVPKCVTVIQELAATPG
ncbi:MAG: hypothetical protein ACE5I3_01745 [Phycisphaerae bacterium]